MTRLTIVTNTLKKQRRQNKNKPFSEKLYQKVYDMADKFILDATAGRRSMWYNKDNPNTIYMDKETDEDLFKRYSESLQCRNRPGINITKHKTATVHANFKEIPYPNNSFNLIVFDPPHVITKKMSGSIQKCFGVLNPETWQSELKKGLEECMRVLKPKGVLLFKWNTFSKRVKELYPLFPSDPLFSQTTTGNNQKRNKSKTVWFCFMKIPEEKEQ